MPVISTADSAHSLVYDLGTPSYANAAWPAANRAYYIPFWLDDVYVPTFAWHALGSPVNGNFDIGVYDAGFTRLWSSGSTACSGSANTNQSVAVSGLTLAPGLYYIAIAFDGTTHAPPALTSTYGIAWIPMSGVMMEESALPLPAIATPVPIDATNRAGTVCGLSSRSFF